MIEGRIPDETTILNFRHLLEEHEIVEKLLESVNQSLREKGVMLKEEMRCHIGIETRDAFKDCEAEMRIAMKPGQRRVRPDMAEGRLHDLIETAKAQRPVWIPEGLLPMHPKERPQAQDALCTSQSMNCSRSLCMCSVN